MTLNISIKDYMGKAEGGVVCLLSIIYDGVSTEAIFWYIPDGYVISVDPILLEKLSINKIEDFPEYEETILYIRTRVVPYYDIYNKIDDVKLELKKEE